VRLGKASLAPAALHLHAVIRSRPKRALGQAAPQTPGRATFPAMRRATLQRIDKQSSRTRSSPLIMLIDTRTGNSIAGQALALPTPRARPHGAPAKPPAAASRWRCASTARLSWWLRSSLARASPPQRNSMPPVSEPAPRAPPAPCGLPLNQHASAFGRTGPPPSKTRQTAAHQCSQPESQLGWRRCVKARASTARLRRTQSDSTQSPLRLLVPSL